MALTSKHSTVFRQSVDIRGRDDVGSATLALSQFEGRNNLKISSRGSRT
jgi:hypothetical protein